MSGAYRTEHGDQSSPQTSRTSLCCGLEYNRKLGPGSALAALCRRMCPPRFLRSFAAETDSFRRHERTNFVRPAAARSALRESRFISLSDSWYFMILDQSFVQLTRFILLLYLLTVALFTAGSLGAGTGWLYLQIGYVSDRFQTSFRPVSGQCHVCRMHSPCHSDVSPPIHSPCHHVGFAECHFRTCTSLDRIIQENKSESLVRC